MIKSKLAAVRYLRRFQRISELIETSVDLLPAALDFDARKTITEPNYVMLGSIVCDIYYPLVREFPELRPTALLGKSRASARYKIVRCLNDTSDEEVLLSDVLPDDADRMLARYESESLEGIYWLELLP